MGLELLVAAASGKTASERPSSHRRLAEVLKGKAEADITFDQQAVCYLFDYMPRSNPLVNTCGMKVHGD